jgi:ribonuclease P protein component
MIAWTMATGGDCTRLGVVTSKRAFRRAVDRNLVRRRFRESFRRNRRRFLNGMDVVLVGRAAALTVPFCSIEREMLDLVGNSSPGARGSRR